MVRTRVGYAGGTHANPTYHDLGDHTETIEIDFDPAKTSYSALLDVFFASHNPCARPGGRQYRSAIFWHDETQRREAEAAAARAAAGRGAIRTALERCTGFTRAEDYHQKYALRSAPLLAREFARLYPDAQAFTDSTAAARANGWIAGEGDVADVRATVDRLGLSPDGKRALLASRGE